MGRRFLNGMGLATVAGLCLAGGAKAGVVNFDDIAFTADPYTGLYGQFPTANGFDEQGLNLYSAQAFVVPKQLSPGPTAFPTAFSSNFWQTSSEPVVITRSGGGLFDLQSLRLGLGAGGPGETSTADTIHISWIKGGSCVVGCSGGQDVNLALGFQTYSFPGLTDLTSFTVGAPNVWRYIAFDDLNFAVDGGPSGAVPEPANWALMILGFAAVGATARRRRAVRPIAAC